VIKAGLLTSAVLYVQAQRVRREFCRAVGKALEGLDLLLTTAADAPAPPHSLATTGNPTYQAPWTMAGVPVITLPCGLSPGGLPLGVQLVGRPFAERELLRAARWSEAALDFRLSPDMQPE
jgi:Asp-tRNA(Asn)/Glu-tRNA(Gln) amidotransferase A subunit family amidase